MIILKWILDQVMHVEYNEKVAYKKYFLFYFELSSLILILLI